MSLLTQSELTQAVVIIAGGTIIGEALVGFAKGFWRGIRRGRAQGLALGAPVHVGSTVLYQPPLRTATGRVLLAPLPAIVTRVHDSHRWPHELVDLVCFDSQAGTSGVYYSTQVPRAAGFEPNSWRPAPGA